MTGAGRKSSQKGGGNIYNTISVTYVKKALGDYKGRLADIHERIQELYRLGNDSEGMIASLTFRKEPEEKQRDLSSLLLRHRAMMAEQEQEIRMEMWRLAEEEETLRRIWVCYRALNELHFKIIRRLYVEKELYASVERECGMSHGKFEKERSAAMKRIVELYHSDLDNLEILAGPDLK
ncbi:MAG TPA: hypothetical protein DCZ20_08245 [Lachnospiraceae bacterium]|nr:hypothetical protein [Lachnospiraceae bacterium]